MRYPIKLLVFVLLLVGCSGTSTSISSVYGDAELLKEKDLSQRYSNEIEELRELLAEEKGLSLSFWNEIGELRELLAEERDLSLSHLNRIENLLRLGNKEIETGSDVPRTLLTSYGPCGYFILDGLRILKLEYDSSLGPWNGESEDGFRTFKNSIRWAETGASLFDSDWDSDGSPFALRPPNVAVSINFDPALNPFFWVKYEPTGAFSEGEVDFDFYNWEEIVGANRVWWSGFFGPDKDCNWDWVYVENSKEPGYEIDTVPGTGYASFLNSNSNIKVNEDGKWVFNWKDYSCPFETRGATAVYDPELHLFVSDCGRE